MMGRSKDHEKINICSVNFCKSFDKCPNIFRSVGISRMSWLADSQ